MMLMAGFGLGVILVILVSIPLMLLVSVSNLFIRGAIGAKHFNINEEFFTEDDGHKVTSIRWKDIKGIWKTGRYVFVKIKRFRYSIIPRRSFGNEYEFVSFYATLIKFQEGAHNNSLQPTGYAGG